MVGFVGSPCKVAISSERRMWIHYRDTKGTEFDKEARKAGGRAKDKRVAWAIGLLGYLGSNTRNSTDSINSITAGVALPLGSDQAK